MGRPCALGAKLPWSGGSSKPPNLPFLLSTTIAYLRMSIYASPDDPRLSRTPLPAYQIHEPPRQPGPRASTPERIRERQVKSVSLL